MNIRQLNEELKRILEKEESDWEIFMRARQSLIDSKPKPKKFSSEELNKVRTLPKETDEYNARQALSTLKSKMREVSSGDDWRLDKHGKTISLSTRYWGSWDEFEEDDDWATLNDYYRSMLNSILTEVQLRYGVRIYEPGSEKKWLDFDVYLK